MSTWRQFADQEPQFAAEVRRSLSSAAHHVLATLRADGSPRVSGTEVSWAFDDGHGPDLVLGSMPGARKARDLAVDARFALHSNPGDGSLQPPDVKLSGRAVEVLGSEHARWVREVGPPSPASHLFRLEPTEVVSTALDPERMHLVIRLWQPGRGVRAFHRS